MPAPSLPRREPRTGQAQQKCVIAFHAQPSASDLPGPVAGQTTYKYLRRWLRCFQGQGGRLPPATLPDSQHTSHPASSSPATCNRRYKKVLFGARTACFKHPPLQSSPRIPPTRPPATITLDREESNWNIRVAYPVRLLHVNASDIQIWRRMRTTSLFWTKPTKTRPRAQRLRKHHRARRNSRQQTRAQTSPGRSR